MYLSFRGRKGFTLIELLVVVATIALLASIVLVSLRGAREGAVISNALRYEASMHRLLGVDLVGWWNFDDPVARYQDLSGGGHDGSCTNCPTVALGVPGVRGNALSFNGSTNFISIPHSAILDSQVFGTTTRFTISAWVHPISWVNWTSIINKSADGWGSNSTNGLWAANDGFRCYMGAGVSGNPTGSTIMVVFRPPLNNWYHIVCSADGDRLRIFVNGIERGSVSISLLTHQRFPSNALVTIGRICVTCTPSFHGLIDDVRLYSRALTSQKVENLYIQTKNKYLTKEN